MRLGIIGTGMIVQDLFQGIEDLPFEEVWLCATERSKEKAEKLCSEFGLKGYVTDYQTLLEKDIDVVYIALPNHLHYRYAKKALEFKKDVIVEKPAVVFGEEWNHLLKIAKENGCILLEAMSIHFIPAFLKLRESLGQIGKVKIVNLAYCQYSSRYDAFRRGEILPAFDVTKAGGALMDINVYNLQAAVALFGKPKSIFYHANVAHGIDTSGIVILDYPDFKVACIGAKDSGAPACSMIQGEDGSICLETPMNHLEEFSLWKKNRKEKVVSAVMEKHRLVYEFREFERIFKERDIKRAEELQEITGIVLELMDEAREQSGVVFGKSEGYHR